MSTLTQHKTKLKAHMVPSGKVYRQLFEAQVQLSDALGKVKEKQEKVDEEEETKILDEKSIPIVREGRGLRGDGILTDDGLEWINSNTNEFLTQNPVYVKHKSEKKKIKLSKLERRSEKVTVNELPDEVVPASKGSNIETRLEENRRKKHNAEWEDMIQEIGLVNMKLEPELKKIGQQFLSDLTQDDIEIEKMLSQLNDENAILNSSSEQFNLIKQNLFGHGEKRRQLIQQLDETYLRIENDRVQNIRSIFNTYAEKLFAISYLLRPEIERLLDDEIQQLNQQILTNKKSYADLYAKLMTADIQREKNQLNQIEIQFNKWRFHALDIEANNLEAFINNMDMLKPVEVSPDGQIKQRTNLEEIELEQTTVNARRIELINQLRKFRPPETTKASVHRWFDLLKDQTQLLKEANSKYINALHMNYEDSNQKIINKMEQALEFLINSHIIDDSNSKQVLEQKLLPIWSKKQKEIEEYIATVETNLEELNELIDRELNNLFKYLQALSHLWDMHELGLVKKERALQELLQDSRRDHDTDNQKREEKLDSILDQMREASNEKDLKRYLSNVALQLDAIKRGYVTFKDSQLELVKQYPEMVNDELEKYKNSVYKFFSIATTSPTPIHHLISSTESVVDQGGFNSSSVDYILKEVLESDRGTKFYVMATNNTPADEANHDSSDNVNNMFVSLDELIPHGKQALVHSIEQCSYLKNCFISFEIFRNTKNLIRMNFINHLEAWLEEGNVRSNSLVAAKCEEINKELELRVHLHEPRMKRAEMDIHNVRAAELLIHEERVERHCAGIEEVIDNMSKEFAQMQNKLVEMANQNKSDILNLEIAFNSATKSLKLISLQEQLNKQKERHMEEVKITLRNFRAKIDDRLSALRSSNAKFRFSFNVFSEGGNFSAEEIDMHKKKLERMALLIDTNETSMLKEMEKLEKKHLDDAMKALSQFQDKFKYNLIDLQFIEKISRWLNETQIKIKINVNESNTKAKELNDLIAEFDMKIDACKNPTLDKMSVKTEDLMELFNHINKLMYERAFYLKCIKNENSVPLQYNQNASLLNNMTSDEFVRSSQTIHQGNLASSVSISNRSNPNMNNNQQSGSSLAAGSTPTVTIAANAIAATAAAVAAASSSVQPTSNTNPTTNNTTTKTNLYQNQSPLQIKSSSKGVSEDPALSIIKNILNANNDQQAVANNDTSLQVQQQIQPLPSSKESKKNSKTSRNSKLSSSSRKAKTRDEMFSYYCTFGEQRSSDAYFLGKIRNILRESLEGILTNSEIFYRDVQQQTRQITHKGSLKNSYPEFADSIINKLKSYYSQCEKYQNQCLKEFRESVLNYEQVLAKLPELIIREIYLLHVANFEHEFKKTKSNYEDQLKTFDQQKAKNESVLRPNLGHPNMKDKLDSLNDAEVKRQNQHSKVANEYLNQLYSILSQCSEKFLKELTHKHENLLVQFDDLLSIADIRKHEISAEKYTTSELLRKKMAGLNLNNNNNNNTNPPAASTEEFNEQITTTNEEDDNEKIKSKRMLSSSSTQMSTAENDPPSTNANNINSNNEYTSTVTNTNTKQRREKGAKWKSIETLDYINLFKQASASVPLNINDMSSTSINTLKATLAHTQCSQIAFIYNEKYKHDVVEKFLAQIDELQKNLNSKLTKWSNYWVNSIQTIKNLYKNDQTL